MPVLSKLIQRERLVRAAGLVHGEVLEFGCGQAKILEHAGARISRYVGIDRNPRVLDEAKARYPDHTFMELDVERDTPSFDAEFDIVLMLAFIEHIFNQRHLFEICCKSLRSSGRLIVTTPTPFGNDVVHRLGARERCGGRSYRAQRRNYQGSIVTSLLRNSAVAAAAPRVPSSVPPKAIRTRRPSRRSWSRSAAKAGSTRA